MGSTLELRPVVATPAALTLPALRSFVSPFTGVVRSLSETLAAPDELRLVSIGCELADGAPTIGCELESYTGSEHWSRDLAEAAAIGEAIERYAGSYVPAERLDRRLGRRARRRRGRSEPVRAVLRPAARRPGLPVSPLPPRNGRQLG